MLVVSGDCSRLSCYHVLMPSKYAEEKKETERRDLVGDKLLVSLNVELTTQPTVFKHSLTMLFCLYLLLAIILSPLG